MPRRLLVFVLFVLGLLVSTIASAARTAYAGTRVGAFDLAAHVGVGLSIDQASEKHRAIAFTCDETASGSPHAAEGAPNMVAGSIRGVNKVNEGIPLAFQKNCVAMLHRDRCKAWG